MIKSKFKFWVILPILLLLLVTVLFFQITYYLFFTSYQFETPILLYFIMILLAYVWIWIFYGELRTKAIIVAIDEKILYKRSYLGLGSQFFFDLSEFDGFITCQLPSKGGTYEYLYLTKNGKKEIKISEFYHGNYPQLKHRVTKTLKFLGDQPFSMLTEIKEVFI